MLRGDSGLRAVHVWPHVSLLPGLGYTFLIDIPPHLIFSSLVRSAAMEGSGRGHLSNVPGANPGCHQDLQVSRILYVVKLRSRSDDSYVKVR